MRIRRVLWLLLAVVLTFTLISCGDEEKIKTTYDEQGNVIREDYYYGGKWEYYIVYTYDEANRKQTATTYTPDDVKTELLEYAYHGNGKLASENDTTYDESGQQSSRQIMEYDADGKKTHLCYFDEQDRPLSSTKYNASGQSVLFEDWQYDENGNFIGRHVLEQNEKGLVIREENYDATDTLTRKGTYSYHANGVMADRKIVNGDGAVIQHVIVDENGETLYEEYGSFRENGKLSESMQVRYENGLCTTKTYKFDQNGSLVEREEVVVEDGQEIKIEKRNANDEVIYYEDATRLDQMLFDDGGNYIGRHTVEFYFTGEIQYEKEVNAKGQLVYERTLTEDGVILKYEGYEYNAAGMPISYHYEENSPEDVPVKTERWRWDGQGNELDKKVVCYNEYGNVVSDERYEHGVLVYDYTAEYYGSEQLRREESYRNDGGSEYTSVSEYDEKNRLIYHYRCGGEMRVEITEIYRYNAADVIVYQERINAAMIDYRVVEEFYDNGQQKSLSVYDKDGTLTLKTEWDEAGNVTSSYSTRP